MSANQLATPVEPPRPLEPEPARAAEPVEAPAHPPRVGVVPMAGRVPANRVTSALRDHAEVSLLGCDADGAPEIPDGAVEVLVVCVEEAGCATRLAQQTDLPVVAVLPAPPADDLRRLLRAGVRGLVLRGHEAAWLPSVIARVAAGECSFDRTLFGVLATLACGDQRERGADDGLTPRQREVLALLPRGLTNSEIAAELGISVDTVKRHVRDLRERLGVATRSQAARVARERGLVGRGA